jgi:peptidoglycan hydrolase-like protein with peptidoglycan-binding domain
MKSKFVWSKLLAMSGFMFLGFFTQVNAVDFNMGTVFLPNKSTVTSSSTSTATSCLPVLTTYHKLGDTGPEVKSLQAFLNDYNGAELNEKGFYGPVTEQEVKNFQYTYGIKVTGVQHVKTTEAINKIKCGQLSKLDRKVFTGVMAMATPSSQTISTYRYSQPTNIYPNAPQKNVLNNKKENLTNKNSQTGTTSTSTITSGFVDGLKADFEKIKENYKAYLLVFALVLALFWFLRKAATE